ncbi:MAG: ATP synthase F1 subunit epsilon [Anaerolineales bacterium]|jgi:F-type H+-transporting ATPase subunit epsilon
MPFLCEIVTQDRQLFSGEVEAVFAPGEEGDLGILPRHTPLLTSLKYGILRVVHSGEEEAFAIAGGILEVRPERVTVLADQGENIEEIDVARAEQAKARAEAFLSEGRRVGAPERQEAQAALRRSNLRLSAVRRFRRGRPPASEVPTTKP